MKSMVSGIHSFTALKFFETASHFGIIPAMTFSTFPSFTDVTFVASQIVDVLTVNI